MVLRAHPLARFGLSGMCAVPLWWLVPATLSGAHPAPARLLALAAAAVAVEAARRTARMRVELSPEGVTVVNFWGTRRAPWHQVTRFVETPKGLRLVRRNGWETPMTAFMASSRELGWISGHRREVMRALESYRRRGD